VHSFPNTRNTRTHTHIGSVPIGGGAGSLACNPSACNGYFSVQCPPALQATSKGAVVRAGCRECPDGPWGNGTMSTTTTTPKGDFGGSSSPLSGAWRCGGPVLGSGMLPLLVWVVRVMLVLVLEGG
jgi:hypothetical protein